MGRFCRYPDCDFIACGGSGKRPAQYERPKPPKKPPKPPRPRPKRPDEPPEGLH